MFNFKRISRFNLSGRCSFASKSVDVKFNKIASVFRQIEEIPGRNDKIELYKNMISDISDQCGVDVSLEKQKPQKLNSALKPL